MAQSTKGKQSTMAQSTKGKQSSMAKSTKGKQSSMAKSRAWHGEYFGSCYISSETIGPQGARAATNFASTYGSLTTPDERRVKVGHGKRRIVVTVEPKFMKLMDAVTQESMQQLAFENILSIDADQGKLVYVSRSLDDRLSISIAHVIMVANASSLISTLKPRVNLKVPEGVCMVTNTTADVSVIKAYYLGFVKVPKSKGSGVVQTAIKTNLEKRTLQDRKRVERRLPKSSLLLGTSKTDDMGTHVSEYPVVIVMSGRSIRYIDIVTGETISKFFLKQITFQGPVVYRSKPDVYGMILHNARLNQANCHIFYLNSGEGKALHGMLSKALKLAETQFGKGDKKVAQSVFSALEGYEREKAPDDLYRKQIRRRYLIPDKVLGAGEYGEVYLATQTNVLDRETKKVTSKLRAVKLLKAGADKAAKDEFTRECQMLIKCEGVGIVRMLGVAVQQAPWLCVLEYLQYGDLRTFLKSAKSKNISLTTGEVLRFCTQLASGAGFISKAKVVHMDLAARNVLLGQDNVVKIADFGMSRPMDPGTNYVKFDTPIRVAIKWTAMEAMLENIFSEASDCWSLGIVFWEICTMGAMPYAHVSNMDMLYFLIGGDRVMSPLECPNDFWEVMLKCWEEDPGARWSFADLVTVMEGLCEKYPVENERNIGKYVTESKGEKPKPIVSPNMTEQIYVYDVPLPNEADGYDIPIDGSDGKKKKRKKKKVKEPIEDDAYDVPLDNVSDDKNDEKVIEENDNEDDAYDIPLEQEVDKSQPQQSERNKYMKFRDIDGGDSGDDGDDGDDGDNAGTDDDEDDPDDAGEMPDSLEGSFETEASENMKQLERKLSLSAHKTLPRLDVRPAARSSSIGEMLIVEEEEEEEEEEGEVEVEAQVIEAAQEEQAEAAEGDLKVTAVEEVILGDEFDEPFGFDADDDDTTTEVDHPISRERRDSIYDGFDVAESDGPNHGNTNDNDSTKNAKNATLPIVKLPKLPQDREKVENEFLASLKRGARLSPDSDLEGGC